MLNKKLLFLIIPFYLLTGCGDFQQPEFEDIEELKVYEITSQNVTVTGQAVFRNPGKQGYKVKNIDLDVIYKEEKIAHINSTSVTKVTSNRQFKIPFSVKLPMAELKKYVLSDIISLLGGKQIELHFKGDLTFSRYGVGKTVPIDYRESVKIKL